MKKKVFWISLLLIACPIVMAPGAIETTHARARGCCMQRASEHSEWYPNGMDFNQCRSANQYRDGNDDLYSPSRLFWWNVNC